MSVTETTKALGSWGLKLRRDTPLHVLDRLQYFGHVAVLGSRDDVRVAGDSLLSSARYVGVLRGIEDGGDGPGLKGVGMAFWLGDEDGKGHVIETLTSFSAATFSATIAGLLPPSVQAGTITNIAGSYSGAHQFQSPRQAIDYVCGLFDADWRVNGNGTLDAGPTSALFVTDPRAAIIRRGKGTSLALRALPGEAKTAADVEDFTTRVVLLAQSTETSTATGAADIAGGLNPYTDLFGNPVKLTRLVSESGTSAGNADSRALLQLNRFTSPRDAVTLSSTTHDMRGTLAVGDSVWAYDPDVGLYDLNNEVPWQGERIHPVKLRVTSLTWPIAAGMGVAFRAPDGTWTDLTDYVEFESGQTTVTVGGYNRSLTATGTEPLSSRPAIVPDTSIPGVPAWVTPFRQSVYQSPVTGTTRAQVELDWTQPLNTDTSVITDGSRYEIRFRTTSQAILPATHSQMAGFTHTQLSSRTHARPLPFSVGSWQHVPVSFDQTEFLLQELTPGVPYEVQIRAVDLAAPANFGAWSASQLIQTATDSIAPETPAAPVVSSNRLALMVRHMLGQAEGGTFNLAADLNHLEIHAQYEPLFEPVALPPQQGGTMLGKLVANDSLLIGQIPAIGTFPIELTGAVYVKVVAVDNAGNKSRPSVAVQSSADLVDAAHISTIFAESIVSGSVSAALILGGSIATGLSGRRAGFDNLGFYAYDATNTQTFEAGGAGDAFIRGTLRAGVPGGTEVFIDPTNQSIKLFPNESEQYFRLKSYTFDQPEDPADAPGLRLEGVNEAGNFEGAYISLSEDSWYYGMRSDPPSSQKQPHFWANRNNMNFGWDDGAGTLPDGRVGAQLQTIGGHWFMYGKMSGNSDNDRQFVTSQGTTAAGFGGTVQSYSQSGSGGGMMPLYTVGSSSNVTFQHAITANSFAGFTLSWNDGGANSHYYLWMRVRV